MSKSGANLRSLVQFPLPQAPAGCVVDTATLRVFASSAREDRTLQAVRVVGDWTENGVTWANQPTTGGPAATADSGTGWVEWDVAQQVQAMLTGTNRGFLISDATENQDAEQQLHSREKGSEAPQLVITFRPAG